jgi:phenylacetyl-CoA:acceptor oxidoreductase subunit 2
MALVALGLFLVLLKIGRPARFIAVLRQPQRSWMTREAWVAVFFFPLAFAATGLESPALMLVAGLPALAFLFSQAMILREARGIPAWRTPAVVPLLVATGLAEGAGLLLTAAATALTAASALVGAIALAALALAAVRAWSWRAYLISLHAEGAPERALAVLDAFRPWLLGLGLVAPAVLIAIGWLLPNTAAPLFALAGLGVCAAGGACKYILVNRAGYNQGFALTHTPVRGSGVPGPAVKPGWR